MPVEIYSDGSCIKNPGPGGIGYVIRYWEKVEGNELPQAKQIEKSIGYAYTTNNRMEILAGYYGIEDVINGVETGIFKDVQQIRILTDSKYFCDAINQRWIDKWQGNNWMTSSETPVKNKDLWEKVIFILNKLRQMGINFFINHIPGHQGYEYNELADKLATAAARGDNQITDEEYEKITKKG